MMRSCTGLVLPRMAPKATHTEPTQKSALIRLEEGKEHCDFIRKYSSKITHPHPHRTLRDPTVRHIVSKEPALGFPLTFLST